MKFQMEGRFGDTTWQIGHGLCGGRGEKDESDHSLTGHDVPAEVALCEPFAYIRLCTPRPLEC